MKEHKTPKKKVSCTSDTKPIHKCPNRKPKGGKGGGKKGY